MRLIRKSQNDQEWSILQRANIYNIPPGFRKLLVYNLKQEQVNIIQNFDRLRESMGLS
jgi:hypothetical protein